MLSNYLKAFLYYFDEAMGYIFINYETRHSNIRDNVQYPTYFFQINKLVVIKRLFKKTKTQLIILSQLLIKHTWNCSQSDSKMADDNSSKVAGISAPIIHLRSIHRRVLQLTESCQKKLYICLFFRCSSRKLGPVNYNFYIFDVLLSSF